MYCDFIVLLLYCIILYYITYHISTYHLCIYAFSPLILANLWDVTDKDIDIYIKGVLEDSDLLLNDGCKEIKMETTANQLTIMEKAQTGRQRCFLKALNGYAPIIYGLI